MEINVEYCQTEDYRNERKIMVDESLGMPH